MTASARMCKMCPPLYAGLYLLFKCSSVLERLMQLARAGKALLLLAANEHTFGKRPPLEETCEAGNAECSICQVRGVTIG